LANYLLFCSLWIVTALPLILPLRQSNCFTQIVCQPVFRLLFGINNIEPTSLPFFIIARNFSPQFAVRTIGAFSAGEGCDITVRLSFELGNRL